MTKNVQDMLIAAAVTAISSRLTRKLGWKVFAVGMALAVAQRLIQEHTRNSDPLSSAL